MSPSKTKNTKIRINISKRESEYFMADHNVLVFDGYLKLWAKHVDDNASDNGSESGSEESDQKNEEILELGEGDKVKIMSVEGRQKQTSGPVPYTESSLITQMKKHGVGRPSTYGKILSDIIEKEFVHKMNKLGEKIHIDIVHWKSGEHEIGEDVKEVILNAYKNRLYSTELGIAINKFVYDYITEIFNYNFTRELQSEMGKIELGQIKWFDVVDKLYRTFAPKLKQFPRYRKKGDPAVQRSKRQIGQHEGKHVYVYLAKYGPVIQIGEDEKPRYVPLPKEYKLDKVSYDEIKYLIGFPYDLGKLSDGRKLVLKKSKYGLYLDMNGKTYNVKPDMIKDYNESRSLERQTDGLSMELIEKTIGMMDKPKNAVREVEDIKIIEGQYGPYFIMNSVLVGVPRCHNVALITHDELMQLYRTKVLKRRGGPKRKINMSSFKKK